MHFLLSHLNWWLWHSSWTHSDSSELSPQSSSPSPVKKSHTFATQKLSSNLSTNNITCPQFRDAEAVGLASELLLAACARLGLAEPGAGLGDGAVGTHADLLARRAVVAGLHACEKIALKHQIEKKNT